MRMQTMSVTLRQVFLVLHCVAAKTAASTGLVKSLSDSALGHYTGSMLLSSLSV